MRRTVQIMVTVSVPDQGFKISPIRDGNSHATADDLLRLVRQGSSAFLSFFLYGGTQLKVDAILDGVKEEKA